MQKLDIPAREANYVCLMKRAGAVLLILAVAIQFAAGTRLFGSQEQWERTCTERSAHLCGDDGANDQHHCALCLVSAMGPGTLEISAPEAFVAVASTCPPVGTTPAFVVRTCDCSCPRAPPASLA